MHGGGSIANLWVHDDGGGQIVVGVEESGIGYTEWERDLGRAKSRKEEAVKDTDRYRNSCRITCS